MSYPYLTRRSVLHLLGLAVSGCAATASREDDAEEGSAAWVRKRAARFDLACTIAALTPARSTTGGPLLVSNSDNPFTTRTQLVVEAPRGGQRYVASRIVAPGNDPPPWDRMPTRGVNESGFAYTWSHVRPTREPDHRAAEVAGGTSFARIGELLLGTATSVKEAIGILEGAERAFHGNFLLADASGDVQLVEASTRSLALVAPSDGTLTRTNHWETPAMRDLCARPALSSTRRLERARAILSSGARLGVTELQTLAADHDGIDEGLSICVHTGGFGTVGSEISDPVRRTLWFCYGWPCKDAALRRAEQSPQQRASWGNHIPFELDHLEPGVYTGADGGFTELGRRHLARAEPSAG